MQVKTRVLQVTVNSPLFRVFDYLCPENITPIIGARVKIPFGRREIIGMIVGIAEKSDFPIAKLKKIISQIDQEALIDQQLLKLMRWSSEYYCHPLGEVLLGTLPKKIREGFEIEKNIFSSDEIIAIEKNNPDFKLSKEQLFAIQKITDAKNFRAFLLAGVTGSGKTEVYMHVIKNILEEKKQVLILVPEIALTPQTIKRFSERFLVPVLGYHSGLSEKKKLLGWMTARSGEPCIIIGTRSAVFSPLKNCGVIIVDESHDISFKQQSGFRYSARDIAVMRANLLSIPIILGTATPSIESWNNVKQNKYELLKLSERAGVAVMPNIIIHDIRNQKLQNGLSQKLINLIQRHLDNNNQVLIFLNRRGFSPVLLCHQCGWTANCKNCDAKLILHNNPKKLICHHCGYQTLPIKFCGGCKQSELMPIGLGTEQLEENLSQLFPQKKIVRIDRDNIKTMKALETILSQIHNQEADILIGTQMLVKGHHFDHVTLVAAIDVDGGLFSADFRATERMGQSLIQVAGRAGRSEKTGEVFIQTYQPDHKLLKILFEENYFKFADELLIERNMAKLPPFNYMAILKAEARIKERANIFLTQAKKYLEKNSAIELIGPLPSLMEKKAGIFRANLLIQSRNRKSLQNSLSAFLKSQENSKKQSGLRWMLDVDPVEMGG